MPMPGPPPSIPPPPPSKRIPPNSTNSSPSSISTPNSSTPTTPSSSPPTTTSSATSNEPSPSVPESDHFRSPTGRHVRSSVSVKRTTDFLSDEFRTPHSPRRHRHQLHQRLVP